jgi:hypothetical protein
LSAAAYNGDMKRVVALALLFAACSRKAELPKTAAVAPPPRPLQQQQPALPPGTLSGKVLETMNAGGYTYLELRTASGDVWAAVQQTKINVGETATIAPQMTLDNFESKTLQRKFDHIIFGVAAEPAPAPPRGNARTVAELWSEKNKLKDAPVAVRGKVVKFLPGIMGKNWLHLRDGSGDQDITVTTDDVVAVGDVVVASGTVRIDKDFGSGYRYAVIVEEAKVSK